MSLAQRCGLPMARTTRNAVVSRAFGAAPFSARLPVHSQRARWQLSVRATTEQEQQAAAAAAQAPAAPAATSKPSAPVTYVEDTEFNISKISFGSILTPLGVFLLLYGFGAYFMLLPGADVSSIMLIYGFPISVLGFALSYAQLKPVPCRTTQAAFDARASQMTDIQEQIRQDTTRYRYGDEQHLDEALDKIFRFNKQGGVPRKLTPILEGLREELSEEGAYTLVLEFSSKMEMDTWNKFQPKIQTFFGPGIIAKIEQTEKGADVYLISDGSGAGRGGGERKDVLPPLMPGLKARQQ